MSTIEVGELLYEVTAKFTGMTEYGVSFESLKSGEAAPPPEGARFDVAFAGALTGPKLKGKITGVDYLRIRADGRFEIHIHAEITADDWPLPSMFLTVPGDTPARLARSSWVSNWASRCAFKRAASSLHISSDEAK